MKLSALFFYPKSPDSGCFLTHPYSTPSKIPRLTPSTTPTNTVKYSFSGGLAQLVKQRTRRSVKYQDLSPWMTQTVAEVEVFSEVKSASTPKHTKRQKF